MLRSVAAVDFRHVLGCSVNHRVHPSAIGRTREARMKGVHLCVTHGTVFHKSGRSGAGGERRKRGGLDWMMMGNRGTRQGAGRRRALWIVLPIRKLCLRRPA